MGCRFGGKQCADLPTLQDFMAEWSSEPRLHIVSTDYTMPFPHSMASDKEASITTRPSGITHTRCEHCARPPRFNNHIRTGYLVCMNYYKSFYWYTDINSRGMVSTYSWLSMVEMTSQETSLGNWSADIEIATGPAPLYMYVVHVHIPSLSNRSCRYKLQRVVSYD